MSLAATVDGAAVLIDEIDAREAALRASPQADTLPRPNTSEGRQLRRWLTQLLVTERVVAVEANAVGVTAASAPTEADVLPDLTARLEIGSVAAAVLADPVARVRFGAADALGEIGAAARESVPALERALEDESEQVRTAAAEALKRIRGEEPRK